MSLVKTDHVTEHTASAGVTVDVALDAAVSMTTPAVVATTSVISPIVEVDTITEKTTSAGVSISKLIKAAAGLAVDTITEFTAAAGVTFSKIINATAGINFGGATLSHYDEGTWTPTLQGSSVPGTYIYSSQVGTYVRIGNLVFVSCYINVTGTSVTPSGNGQIAGLPFLAKNVTNRYVSLSVGEWDRVTLGSGYTQLSATIAPNTQVIGILKGGTTLSAASVPVSDLTGNPAMVFSGVYLV